ncbi:MAG: NAD(P)/FAD-dependent oxidoreductase [Bacteroidales bacterium]|jgi:protoporphyrinogen oxidase|nr:NAD(P)/FAD-dependent oxidoreductase [Bacteroidales bacterium]
MTTPQKTWGIIGGGIMGMTLALRLAQKGDRVTILESAPKLGGLTSAIDMDGIKWDRFYHVILLSDLNTRRIIKEIGLESELKWVETKTGFYSGGKLYSMSNIFEFLKFPPINLFDKLRLGLTIIAASLIKDLKRMEAIPVEKWLVKWSGKKVFQKIWLPLLKSKLGDHYKITSASFIWTTIQRMYAARKTGLKKEMFGYVTGGYEKINSAFEEKLRSEGVAIILNVPVKQVVIDPSGRMKVATLSSEEYIFEEVISTLPSDISVKIVSALSVEEIERHNSIRYLGVICPSILLSRPVSKYYVTNITDSWPPFTGIIEMTALVDTRELGNRSLVYLPKYIEPGNELFNQKDDEIREYFLGALFKMYPDLSESDIISWNVSSARRVFAIPTLNYSAKLPSVTTSLKGYYIINSAQIINGTLNVNETVQVAETKLKEILRDEK